MRKLNIFVVLLTALGLIGFWGKAISQSSIPVSEQGKVLGAKSIEFDLPNSLLPVEQYIASPSQLSQEEFLASRGIKVYPQDIVRAFPDPAMQLGSVISIARATPVQLIDGKKSRKLRSFASTVGDLFKETGTELGQDDIVQPTLDTPLAVDMTITITRVEFTLLDELRPINFKRREIKDNNLEKGKSYLKQKGRKGQIKLTYKLRRENGQEVSRKLVATKVVKEPIEEIRIIGTKEVVYGTGKATWFGAPKLTAAHNSLPRGTRVKVTNIKNGKSVIVKIIGGGILGNAIIDLSPDAFAQLAPLSQGIMQVRLTRP